MIAISKRIALTVLAISLAPALPAIAQQPAAAPSGAAPAGGMATTRDPNGGWNADNMDRQEFREEMGQIRKEHEDLEAAQDRLMDKCVNVTTAQAAECQKERETLKERHQRLHERMKVLHEKMEEAARNEHNEHHAGPQPGHPAASAPTTQGNVQQPAGQ